MIKKDTMSLLIVKKNIVVMKMIVIVETVQAETTCILSFHNQVLLDIEQLTMKKQEVGFLEEMEVFLQGEVEEK